MNYVTRKSWIELRERLAQVEKQVRIDMADEIKRAASFGDFSENAELDAAREKQQILTLEVQRLREKLNQAEIIDDLDIDASRVSIGTSVTLYDHGQKEEIKWTILGEDDSNPSGGVISYQSPLAKGLMGREEGDEVTVHLPGGHKAFEIVSVEPAEIAPPDASAGDGHP
ncbi:MAG: transcription elongation factor GreA [Nitrospinota bacterium]|jgi:transcription elongation factor GreA|nr:transcription elongation factor GreA [Nitrospinota bacterium]HJM42191.1 transcription elongation factor GreA [Nitrospinota bacterium]